MKPSKQKVGAIVVALAVSGWLIGRSVGTHAATEPEPERSSVDPHVTVRAPAIAERILEKKETPTNPRLQIPEETYHPRDADEWQGMLVDMSMRQLCDESSRCGLGLSCLADGKCGPCERDADCAAGEACVLDYCLPASNVECSAREDCAHVSDDAYCVLSGLTGGEPRGNSDMRSYCLASSGGDAPDPETTSPRFVGRAEAPSFDRRSLLDDLR